MHPQLKQAAKFIQSRQTDDALSILNRYLAEHPSDSTGWWLRSFALTTPEEKLAAIQSALSFDPGNAKLRQRQAVLQKMLPRQSGQRRKWLVAAAAGICLLTVFVAGILAVQVTAPVRPLPTLISFAATNGTPSRLESQEDSVPSGSTIRLPVSEPEDARATLPAATITPAARVTVEAAATSFETATEPAGQTRATTTPLADNRPAVVSSVVLSPVTLTDNLPPNPTREADVEVAVTSTGVPVQETPVSTATPAALTATPVVPTPTAPAPTAALPVLPPGIPVNTALNFEGGEMRVVSAIRPAEAQIRQLGGTIPPAPDNSSWVLVEMLMICGDANACVAGTSGLEVTGSSGAVYRPSSQLNMTPLLGSVVSNGQVWGYLGFVVPRSESQLRLVLPQGSQSHVFALE